MKIEKIEKLTIIARALDYYVCNSEGLSLDKSDCEELLNEIDSYLFDIGEHDYAYKLESSHHDLICPSSPSGVHYGTADFVIGKFDLDLHDKDLQKKKKLVKSSVDNNVIFLKKE